MKREQELGVRKLVYVVFTSRKDQDMRARGMTSKSDVQGAWVGLARASPMRRAMVIRLPL